jgi:thiol-disulfide isomerase/thioredoxin
MRSLVLALAFFVAAIAVGVGKSDLRPATAAVTIGDGLVVYPMTAFRESVPAGAIELAGPDGPVRLADHAGEVVIATAWATWCGVCKRELPKLAELRLATGTTVLPVSVEPGDSFRKIGAYFFSHDLATLPVLRDETGAFRALAQPTGIPTSLVIDRFGQVVGRFSGAAPWRSARLRAWLAALSAAKSPAESRALWRMLDG